MWIVGPQTTKSRSTQRSKTVHRFQNPAHRDDERHEARGRREEIRGDANTKVETERQERSFSSRNGAADNRRTSACRFAWLRIDLKTEHVVHREVPGQSRLRANANGCRCASRLRAGTSSPSRELPYQVERLPPPGRHTRRSFR